MSKQTIISIITLVVAAVAIGLIIKFVPAPANNPGQPMGKLPGGSAPAVQSSDLVGTWVWKHIIVGGDAIAEPMKPGVFTITFTADGKVSGTTDCNSFGGQYTLGSDGVITFGPFASTLMFCEGSQEPDFMAALAQTNRLTTDTDGNLIFVLGDTSNVLVFARQ